jgi:hypothetical protein
MLSLKLDDWTTLAETLDAMAPGDYLLALRALARRDEDSLDPHDRAVRALIDRAAAADVRGLLAFAEEGFSFDRMKLAGPACFCQDADATLAVLQRMEAAIKAKTNAPHPDEGKMRDVVLLILREERVAAQPAATLQALSRAGVLDADPPAKPNLESVIHSWAEQDAAAAIAFAERYPQLLRAAMDEWAEQSPEAVMAWMEARPERVALTFGEWPPNIAETWRDNVLRAYARAHPVEAAQYAGKTADAPAFLGSLAEGMKQLPGNVAAAWVQSLPEAERRDACLQQLSGYDRDGGARVLEFCRLYPEAFKESRAGAFEQLRRERPQELAHALLAALLTENERADSLHHLMNEWHKNAPAAADAFVQSLPPGELKGGLLMDGMELLQYGREDALAWAGKLPDAAERAGAMRYIESHSRQ